MRSAVSGARLVGAEASWYGELSLAGNVQRPIASCGASSAKASDDARIATSNFVSWLPATESSMERPTSRTKSACAGFLKSRDHRPSISTSFGGSGGSHLVLGPDGLK